MYVCVLCVFVCILNVGVLMNMCVCVCVYVGCVSNCLF